MVMAGEAKITRPHNLILEDRSRLSVSGVDDVVSFDEGEAVLQTSRGSLTLRGSGMRVERLSLDTGELSLEGLVTELSYDDSGPEPGFWRRLFG